PPGDSQSSDVATMFFADEEANALLVLRPILDPVRRARWQASIAAAASYLAPQSYSWYSNGNLNLGETELMYLAWRATGNPVWGTDYNRAWAFVLSPPQGAWPGRG